MELYSPFMKIWNTFIKVFISETSLGTAWDNRFCVTPPFLCGPLQTYSSAGTLICTTLGGDRALWTLAALFALHQPNPGLQGRAVWGRCQNYAFSASVSCEIGSASPRPMDVTLSLLFSFNNSNNWSSVSSEVVPLAVSVQVQACAGHSHSGVAVSVKVSLGKMKSWIWHFII